MTTTDGKILTRLANGITVRHYPSANRLIVTDEETGIAVSWNIDGTTFRVWAVDHDDNDTELAAHTLYGDDGGLPAIGAAGAFAVRLLAQYGEEAR